MRYNAPSTNFLVFILFFGLALIEAIQSHDWLKAGIFFALGAVSLWGDFLRKNNKS
jgi:hypothetical protein